MSESKRTYDWDRLNAINARMSVLRLPFVPAFYMDDEELHRLAGADDRELIAWSVTEKLLQRRIGGSFYAEFKMAIDPAFEFSEIIVHEREA